MTPRQTIYDNPIEFREIRPGDKPGIVVLVFDAHPSGFLRTIFELHTSGDLAAKVKDFCVDRKARGLPVYQKEIEEIAVYQLN
jgi:hypothetical protein